MIRRIICTAVVVILSAAGAASEQRSDKAGTEAPTGQAAAKKADLAGRWLMTLPAGAKYQVVVQPAAGKQFRVEKAVRFSGVYEVRGERLVLVTATNARDTGFEWEIRGPDELTLVAQPPVEKTGSDYLGATLKRLPAGAEDFLPPKKDHSIAAAPKPIPKPLPGPAKTKVLPTAGAAAEEAKWVRILEQVKGEYRLRKEPAYRGPAQYCLFLLGRDAKVRMWLVSDGSVMYVDRNGNGDITEPAEAIPFKKEAFASFVAKAMPEHGTSEHLNLHIAVRQHDWEQKKGGYWAIRADVEGRYQQYAFVHKFPQKPQDAPVVHLGGPLQMGLSRQAELTLVPGKPCELEAWIVSQYPGVERAFIDHSKGVPETIHPVVEIRFPAKTPGAEPITVRAALTQRC